MRSRWRDDPVVKLRLAILVIMVLSGVSAVFAAASGNTLWIVLSLFLLLAMGFLGYMTTLSGEEGGS